MNTINAVGIFNAEFLRNTILIILWTEFIWETYLSYRQFKKVKRAKEVPEEIAKVFSKEQYEKSREYSLAKLKFGFVKYANELILTSAVIYSFILAYIWNYSHFINPRKEEITTSLIWLFIVSTLLTLFDLPLTVYSTFVLEKKFGFNKQKLGYFICDQIKAFLGNQIILLIISPLLIIVIKSGGPYFFIWLWLVVCVLSMIFLTIYPSVIAPLFDKYTPLPDGELRTQIETLTSQLKFPLSQIYLVKWSKRSSHSNACLMGLFKSWKIILFDTLIAKGDGTGCQNDEIVAILCHELGHWNHNHLFKKNILIQLNLLLIFLVFSIIFKYRPLYEALGFFNVQPILVGLFVALQYVIMPYKILVSFLMNYLSRRFEFQADKFAAKLGKGEPLERALLKLYKDNLTFPIVDKVYSAWYQSHPSLFERISAIRKVSAQSK